MSDKRDRLVLTCRQLCYSMQANARLEPGPRAVRALSR